MSKEDFIQKYAERSGITVEHLLKHKECVKCNCGDDICEGYVMVFIDDGLVKHRDENNI